MSTGALVVATILLPQTTRDLLSVRNQDQVLLAADPTTRALTIYPIHRVHEALGTVLALYVAAPHAVDYSFGATSRMEMGGDGAVTATLAYLVFAAYFSVMMSLFTRIGIRWARIYKHVAWLRTGLVLVAVGAGLQAATGIHVGIYCILTLAGHTPPWAIGAVQDWVWPCGPLVLLAGLVVAAIGVRLEHRRHGWLRAWWGKYRARCALRPMWDRMSSAMPVISRIPTSSSMPEPLLLAVARTRLSQCLTEIYEGYRIIQAFPRSAELMTYIEDRCRHEGLTGDRLGATSTAALVLIGLHRWTHEPAVRSTATAVTSRRSSGPATPNRLLADEVLLWRRVGTAFAECDYAAGIAADYRNGRLNHLFAVVSRDCDRQN